MFQGATTDHTLKVLQATYEEALYRLLDARQFNDTNLEYHFEGAVSAVIRITRQLGIDSTLVDTWRHNVELRRMGVS